MIEFSENLTKRYEGVPAMAQRAFYRLTVRKGEIPYFNGGLDIQEFTYGGDLAGAVNKVLSDFQVSVAVSGNRVLVGDIMIDVPGGLI